MLDENIPTEVLTEDLMVRILANIEVGRIKKINPSNLEKQLLQVLVPGLKAFARKEGWNLFEIDRKVQERVEYVIAEVAAGRMPL